MMAQAAGSGSLIDPEWAIGDALLAAIAIEDLPGTAKAAAARATHRDLAELTWIGRTCAAFRFDQRRADLPFSHHRAVLDLPAGDRVGILDKASAGGWTGRQIRRAVLAARVAGGSYVPPFDDDVEDKAYRGIVQAWNRASRSARALFIESADETGHGDIML